MKQRYEKAVSMVYFPVDKRICPEKASEGASSISPSPVLKASVFAVMGSMATELKPSGWKTTRKGNKIEDCYKISLF